VAVEDLSVEIVPCPTQVLALMEEKKRNPNPKPHGAKTHCMGVRYRDEQENGRLGNYLMRRSLSRRRGRSNTPPTFISSCKGREVTSLYSCSCFLVNRLFSLEVAD